MNYVEVDNLYKSFAEKVLFEDISFKIEKGDKIAMIAKNGTGKTTLINIILGNELPDSGKVLLRNDIHINFLNQDTNLNPALTVFETIFESENTFVRCIKNYQKCLSDFEKDNSKSSELESAIAMMDVHDAWNYENKIKEILQVFEIPDLEELVGNLSGGQQKRLALAKTLIDKSDLLFLDEPTNHLDIGMIEWLESYLIKEKTTLFLISHDRYFIDNVCDVILELDDHKLFKYKSSAAGSEMSNRNMEYEVEKLHNPKGAYSNFLVKKAERIELESKTIEKARNRYKVELEWMRRQPQARQTKSKKRIETFYEIEKTAKQTLHNDSYKFKVEATRLGKKIMEVYNLSKSYGEKKLISNFSYTFMKDDKIGIVGKNGSGKSTFFKLLTEQVKADAGKILVGSTVRIGYFGQEGLQFNNEKKIIDIVKEFTEVVNIDSKEIGASQFLTWFNFPPAVQHNKYGKLSGGEKRRLYLLLILLQQPNFLILDEPTNDLDIQTLNLLEEFLESYEGVLLIASHDRLFLDKLSNHIFAFEGNGNIKDYPGNYSQYVEWKAKKALQNKQIKKEVKQTEVAATQKDNDAPRKATFKEKKEYEELTNKIELFETEKKDLINKLSNTQDAVELDSLSKRYAEVENELMMMEDRWLELAEIVESIK
ncbi:ABC-F family ATP-binding cassette domain-containing protein [Bacteroidales bacterium OttesenSCG-928-K03]|nr:ABC-F family ATP-binding cassette domain-containing protein [Odoribacter sp. OttesenSCG-928-L07]MDL2238638.1 ABC-F family ATP-binding cassette domain-containing protein [Bacteroidales bacterium OttesenSCG-928-L14]MDL2240273.1 ABC-F family ATP-binding cassette domain-containing protein [Bacteroidales bacterium OttesenSCG-928-K22]MDL2242710.1 ABC-F family ATP-binding cassette domain-containing protein [Bacteroidales bacterium OttesenSCG-928-K03]